MYKAVIRPLLFLFTPEKAHKITSFLLKVPLAKPIIRLLFAFQNKELKTDFAAMIFKNPVGLAAGFDKDAELLNEMKSVGFGFIEIGTLTPLAQPGNVRPRLFRLPKDKALINRMGFNNKGVENAIKNLKKFRKGNVIVGGNIGKNKNTPLDRAVDDYLSGFNQLHSYVDYFVVNVSSPNTPNLRQLQDREPLTKILQSLTKMNKKIKDHKPIFLKIAPDLTNSQLDDIIEIVIDTGIAGIVATNTTIQRKGLESDNDLIDKCGQGGLSGIPLRNRATEVIQYISSKAGGRIPIMAAGGIHSAEDAIQKLEAGASMVQLYTGFIYEGPGLVKKINKAILEHRNSVNKK